MDDKIFYTMGEVAEMFDLPASTLRFWEENFPALRPKRNKKGNRLYTQTDIAVLKKIYYLVRERGLKIDAAVKQFRTEGNSDRNVELVERLQKIRALLTEIKQEIGEKEDREEIGDRKQETEISQQLAVSSQQLENSKQETEQSAISNQTEEKETILHSQFSILNSKEPLAVEQLLF